MASRITHFEIYGDKPEKLAAFYGELFGWQMEQVEGIDYWRIRFDPNDADGVDGGLTHRPPMDPKSWIQFINVDSIDDSLALAHHLGATVLRPKTAVARTAWIAILADPAGNTFAIWQPDATAFPPLEPD